MKKFDRSPQILINKNFKIKFKEKNSFCFSKILSGKFAFYPKWKMFLLLLYWFFLFIEYDAMGHFTIWKYEIIWVVKNI